MFLNDDFLLSSPMAKTLFNDYAKEQPIIDYHCHLDPKEIYEDRLFRNLTEAWLAGDHYKWRLMRANGIPESHITGDASDYDKFLAWATTVPNIIGNPLYSWTHLELKRFFDVHQILNAESAPEIWRAVNAKLSTRQFSRRNLIKDANVKVVCTTDDPTDNLIYHQKLREDRGFDVKVLPTFRPDQALRIGTPSFIPWIQKLSGVVGTPIDSLTDLKLALTKQVTFFHGQGCRLADHALDTLGYEEASEEVVAAIFKRRLQGAILTKQELVSYQTFLLLYLFERYHYHGWTMQLHIHAQRNNNTPMMQKLGPDTGYDGMADGNIAEPLYKLLNAAEQENYLPKMILYSLNPKDFPVLATLMGCFQKDEPGKIQLGSGWWFNDTRHEMRHQLTTFADNSTLCHFVGMLTDSRSFLSYSRHEYFRRVLCDLIGEWYERGEAPDDVALLGKMVADICYNNARNYFKL